MKYYFRYSKNAKMASERFNDRPMSPAESVIYWTEYIIRHKGAPHLKTHAHNLAWYQYFLLDVIAVIFIIILIGFYIVRKGLRAIGGFFFKSLYNLKVKSE